MSIWDIRDQEGEPTKKSRNSKNEGKWETKGKLRKNLNERILQSERAPLGTLNSNMTETVPTSEE